MTINETFTLLIIYLIRSVAVFGAVLLSVPFWVLLERKLLARVQQRAGPDRVGVPLLGGATLFRGTLLGGHLQTIIDGIKLFLKENLQPNAVDRPLFTLAPLLSIVPAIFVLAIVPLGPPLELAGGALTIPLIFTDLTIMFPAPLVIPMGITDLEIGILFYLAVTGIGVYGIVLAGWSSNSKYSLLGGIRSSAQMLSYEIALGLSMVGVLLIAGTFELRTLIAQQDGGFWNWYVFKQPVGFLLFMTAGFAETNRLPFDLPEGESELGGGFHTEYSSMKFAMFFMSEYMNMFTFAAILTTLFLGGFHGPIPEPFAAGGILSVLWGLGWFGIKIFFLMAFMIFIRGTWPRLRYDQLMDLGWKVMFPIALVNMTITAGVLALGPARPAEQTMSSGMGLTAVLLIAGVAQIVIYDWLLTVRRKRVLGHVA